MDEKEKERVEMEQGLARISLIEQVIRLIEYNYKTQVFKLNYSRSTATVPEKKAVLKEHLSSVDLSQNINPENIRILKSIFLSYGRGDEYSFPSYIEAKYVIACTDGGSLIDKVKLGEQLGLSHSEAEAMKHSHEESDIKLLTGLGVGYISPFVIEFKRRHNLEGIFFDKKIIMESKANPSLLYEVPFWSNEGGLFKINELFEVLNGIDSRTYKLYGGTK